MLDIREVLSYDDVSLCPRYSPHRMTAVAELEFDYYGYGNYLPIINAPMDMACSSEMIRYLHNELGMMVTIHRAFKSPDEQLAFLSECKLYNHHDGLYHRVFMAVGSLGKQKDWIDKLIETNNVLGNDRFQFLVDMANGDSLTCVETVEYIRGNCPKALIMAGNVAVKSGYDRLVDAGATFVRVGIGGGACCTTRRKTGFGIPTFTSVADCAKSKEPFSYLVADGGIGDHGDVCKAMAAGADMVMAGRLFAGTDMSPGIKFDVNGSVINPDTKPRKRIAYCQYRGMASEAVQTEKFKSKRHSVEGVSGMTEYKGETREYMPAFLKNLASSMVYYGGCTTWPEFYRRAKFVRVTTAGLMEGHARIES